MRVLRGGLVVALALLLTLTTMAQSGTIYWPEGAGHNHRDHAAHVGLGLNTEQLSHLGFGGSIGELDIAVDPLTGTVWIAVALLSGGFALVDGTDPEDPQVVSTASTSGYGADVKIATDSNTVYLSLQSGTSGPACFTPPSGIVLPTHEQLGCGVQVWDTTIKAQPRFLVTIPAGTGGSHMVDIETLNGVPILAMAAQGTPNGVPIAIVGADKLPIIVSRAPAGFVHDMTLASDPLDPERSLVVVANWNDGVRVYDITLPTQPSQIAHWVPPPGSGGRIHTVMITEVEDRRIIIATQENFFQNVVSEAFFLDATDWGDIQLLGRWGNPQGHTTVDGFRWSTHNFNVLDGRMTMAHYHGGVLVFDISTLDKLQAPVLLANFIPTGLPTLDGDAVPKLVHGHLEAGVAPTHDPDGHAEVPNTWDAMEHDGIYWAADINSGLYAFRLV